MAVDETSLERIRNATFPAARRGYDRREVEKFLNRLADWLETGGSDEARSDTVKKELERVGQRTGAILAQAEESAQQIRAEAEKEAEEAVSTANAAAEQTRKEADGYSQETRSAADSYAGETRKGADGYAEETRRGADQEAGAMRAKAEEDANAKIEAAEAQARRTVEEGVKRRHDIEAVISDLARHRDDVIVQIEQLSTELTTAAGQHKPAEGADPFAIPEELDPMAAEGEEAEVEAPEAEAAAAEPEEQGEGEADLDPEAEAEAERRPARRGTRRARRKATSQQKT